MLRRNAAAEASSTTQNVMPVTGGSGHALDGRNNNRKSSRKTTKKRQQNAIVRGCVIVLIALVLMVLLLVSIMTRSSNPKIQKYTPSKLRRNRNFVKQETGGENLKKEEHDTAKVGRSSNAGRVGDFLPPNSVYKVSMEMSYEELSILQEKYRQKGFSVLAFPINDFRQELPSNEEIETWVHHNFPQASFPMFRLSSLEENPVFSSIRKQLPEQTPKWNFFKYLVDGNGRVVKVYDHRTNPLALITDIEAMLEANNLEGGGRLVTE
ncbi:glutathione S-transferase N-terminal domain containing protein [Nitzschia inconspicua]|uniref:Glutathione S-transferase N-terminal domain containing protein n=1 Tax=Nitzschia inconspicua TaxID=303405 RepID=A0A9K3KQR4_9STRA|nr:glutathione S-transferase N-terminal domain containing protein [Nitzschia inconspicua]